MKYASLLLFLVLAACSKDKNNMTSPNRTQLITSASWKYQSGGIDQDRNGSIDIALESTGQVQPCALDNTGTFQSNGSGTADEGATKCSASAPQTTPFTWNFASNETVLNIAGGGLFGLGGSFKIRSLTATTLTLSKDTTISTFGFPLSVDLILNLKH